MGVWPSYDRVRGRKISTFNQHTYIKFHRSCFEGEDSQALLKLNNVIGGLVKDVRDAGVIETGTIVSRATVVADCRCEFAILMGGTVGGTGPKALGFSVAGIGLMSITSGSLVGKIVCCPEARKIPPPTRLGFVHSLACFASSKAVGTLMDCLRDLDVTG